MGRRPSTFTQADITRTIKGVVAAGVAVCVIVDPRDGRITIEPISDRKGPPEPKPPIVL